MSCCKIANGSFYENLVDKNNFIIDIEIIKRLLPQNQTEMNFVDRRQENVWFPLFIDGNSSASFYRNKDLLIKSKKPEIYDPCNCIPATTTKYSGELKNTIINCDYCKSDNYINDSSSWTLQSKDGQSYRSYNSTCGTDPITHKDIRANDSDLFPRIPVLNNGYITDDTIIDERYNELFPCVENSPLGIEGIAKTTNTISNKFFTLNSTNSRLQIDWKIGAKIGEIPFNGTETHHKDVDTHIKSYNRFLQTNKTCGNFILLKSEPYVSSEDTSSPSGILASKYKMNPDNIPGYNTKSSAFSYLPTDEEFTIPYGFSAPTINNIFINQKKELSYWFWHYDKAVLCWYRFSPAADPARDSRPIPGVDLYISDGDVFWASIDSKENISDGPGANQEGCPRGVRVIDLNNKIKCVVPDNSEFIYISKNIYPKFLRILDRLEKYTEGFINRPAIEKINIAAIQATGPSFDEITLDTFKTKGLSKVASVNSDSRVVEFSNNETLLKTYMARATGLRARLDEFINSYDPNQNIVYIEENNRFNENRKAINDMLAKNNKNMSALLSIPSFEHQPSVSKLNYIYNKESLLNTLANKYGCYLNVSSPCNIELKQSQSAHLSIELDFEVCPTTTFPTGQSKITTMGYDQTFQFATLSSYTQIDKNEQFKAICVSGQFRNQQYAKMFGSLIFDDQTIDRKPLYTGQLNFVDTYYRGSYDLAVKIDGEQLCSKYGICDQNLYDKYKNVLSSDIQPITFINNDLKLDRKYSILFNNPNINNIAIASGGGLFYESNTYGTGTVFLKNKPASLPSGKISIGFTPSNVNIKLYDISIEKLRSANNLSCKILPVQNRCKCLPISSSDFIYGSKETKNSDLWTPDVSTLQFTIKKFGGRSSNDPIVINSVQPPSAGSTIPKLGRYEDPEYKGCPSTYQISLPIYTKTNWPLTLSNFNLPNHRLWAAVSDSTSLTSSQNKVQVNINSISIFDNQERPLTSNYPPTETSNINIELLNNKYIGAMGDRPILYQPLSCSLEGTSIHNINITFKYLPDKHLLYFVQGVPKPIGTLNIGSYSASGGLKFGSDGTANNTDLRYDSKTHLFSFSDNAASGIRYVGQINQQLISVLSNLNNLENNKINLHVKSRNKWLTVKADYFGYYWNKKSYIGYPIFHEYITSTKNKKLTGFLGSFKLENPNFIFKNNIANKDYVYQNNIFKNFINIDGIQCYFKTASISNIYHKYNIRNNNNTNPNKTNLIDDLYHGFIRNNLIIGYDNKNPLANNLDTLIVREDCYTKIQLISPKTFQAVNCTILTKYIFRSKNDGRLYTSFRLVDSNGNVFDTSVYNNYYINWNTVFSGPSDTIQQNLRLDSLAITRKIPNIVEETDPILKNSKWADVYGFDKNFRTFDITNKLDNLIDAPSLLTYENILYDLYLYNYVYSLAYNQSLPININNRNLIYNTNSFITMLSYLYTDDNSNITREEKDYLYPFIDLNYFSNSSQPLSVPTGDMQSGNIHFPGFRTIKPQAYNNTTQLFPQGDLNPDYGLGYFWLHIPNDTKYEINDSVYTTTFKSQQPKYLLTSNQITVGDSAGQPLSSQTITPTYNLYQDGNINGSLYNSDKYMTYPIYYHQNLTENCNNTCGIGILRQDGLTARFSVADEDYLSNVSLHGSEYYITVGNGSLYTYPYINRSILDPISLDSVFPGKNSQGERIHNNSAPFLSDNINDIIKGNKFNGLSKTQNNVDIIANEMLYRLYYGSLQKINADTVGSRTLPKYIKQQKLSSLKYLIENNNDITPKDIYDLIPYEYDNDAETKQFLKFNGNISIYGAYKPGDTSVVKIGNNTYNISIEENDKSIDLVIGNFRSVLHTKKIQTSGLHVVTVGNGATPVNTETTTYTKVGSCTTYFPTTWSVFSYFTEYTPDGVSLYDRYTKCQEIYDYYSNAVGFQPNRLWQAVDVYVDQLFGGDIDKKTELNGYIGPAIIRGTTTPVFLCGECPCLDEFCSNHEIYPDGPFPEGTIIAAQSNHRVAPGGRATYKVTMCIGGNEGPCYPRPAGAPDMVSPSFYTGGPDQIAGGYNPREPFVIPMFCGYTGCGPQCLDINYTDKFGNEVYLNQIRSPGYLSNAGIPATPCQCIPYDIINCEKPQDRECYTCINREQNKYSYNFEYGDYNFNNIPASVTRDLTSSPPSLGPQQNIRFPDFSDCVYDWSPIGTSGPNNASEVCGFTENPSSQIIYDIYQRVDITTQIPELPLCPAYIVGIEFNNNQIIFNCPNGDRFCSTISTIQTCPSLEVTVPQDNNRYYFTNNIESECSDCGNKPKFLSITNNQQPEWETVIEDRIAILGLEPLEGDINYTVVGGGAGYVDRPLCGANIFEPCCWDGCYNGYSGPRQCGKNAPDSWAWSYCLECNIPGSPAPELKQQRGGSSTNTYIYGGIVTNCLGFNYLPVSSPQIKDKYLAEWQKVMRLKYLDVAPCHNNQSINVNNLIEGVIPGSCSLNFTTLSYPGLAFRRTRDGAESRGFVLGVHVAYIRYQYKRPKNIQDVLFDESLCNSYNSAGNSYVPVTKNMVEKIVNGGLCNREIICKDESVETCNQSNYCCRLNIGRAP